VAKEREPLVVAQAVMSVSEAQRARLEAVPAPRDVVRVEVPNKRRLPVDRRHVRRQVIAAAGSAAANRVKTVGPGRARDRAEPPIADRELPREVIVDRDVDRVVVAHHSTRIRGGHAATLKRPSETRHEPVHLPLAELQVDRIVGMLRIVRDRGAIEMVDPIGAPIMLVGELRS
jgi:Ser-tRNA(Ala) deacylase AlaX